MKKAVKERKEYIINNLIIILKLVSNRPFRCTNNWNYPLLFIQGKNNKLKCYPNKPSYLRII